eukprot:CAMPEP_0114604370 /NCGR_PEP_ID=MMETSP0168-20121206/510_1 /TAXON_ID=95228 ORGANISM="Vannella sp., Strain DIVA3 517/6/12" /NCGR_SAMPLE_ID=MMETSP0168 /ASSEMBLY_ACC=CAM_ASM_000044 /LENGTH=269 /DNA_ID=CAMNT_0001815199 /DNA_START=99 /DNA_END=908 /DNA_ORIENTATION=+
MPGAVEAEHDGKAELCVDEVEHEAEEELHSPPRLPSETKCRDPAAACDVILGRQSGRLTRGTASPRNAVPGVEAHQAKPSVLVVAHEEAREHWVEIESTNANLASERLDRKVDSVRKSNGEVAVHLVDEVEQRQLVCVLHSPSLALSLLEDAAVVLLGARSQRLSCPVQVHEKRTQKSEVLYVNEQQHEPGCAAVHPKNPEHHITGHDDGTWTQPSHEQLHEEDEGTAKDDKGIDDMEPEETVERKVALCELEEKTEQPPLDRLPFRIR